MKTSMLLPVVMIGLFLAFMASLPAGAAVKMECPALQEQNLGGIRYMSGGSELDKDGTMRHMVDGYNLGLVFARDTGEYLSNVQVTIQGLGYSGYLETESCGPWFYARLPRGEYRVTVDYNGMKQVREFRARSSPKVFTFQWES
jgi:hypothetical protein